MSAAGPVTFCVMDARDFAAMTAGALNSMEQRLEGSIAELKGDVAELRHDIRQLDVKVDVTQRTMSEQMDRGFRQIIDHIDRR